MNKIPSLFAAAMLAAATLPLTATLAAAQNDDHSGIVMADNNIRASKLVGMPVINDQGEELGTVREIMVNGGASEPMVVMSPDNTKMVLVPMSHIAVKGTTVTVHHTRTELMAMPKWEFNGLNSGGNG